MPASSTCLECCLLGGLLGDAWGHAYEGSGGKTDPEFPLQPRISDDTQLVMATCEALVACQGMVDPAAIAERFRDWFVAGRLRGLGSATLKALRDLACGGHWALCGARGEYAAGCGAAMRAAPLAFFLDPAQDDHRRALRDVARITHHHDEAYAGALAVVCAIRRCWSQGRVADDLLLDVADMLPDCAVRDRLRQLHQIAEPQTAATWGTSGHVVDAVPLALRLAVANRHDLPGAIRAAIALGGDCDTIAALAAQVVGSAGCAPPAELLARVAETDALGQLASNLWPLVPGKS